MRLTSLHVLEAALAGLAALAVVAALAGPVAADVSVSPLSAIVVTNPGSAFSLLAQGSIDEGSLINASRQPMATTEALKQLARTHATQTFERTWQEGQLAGEIQDLVVKFATVPEAQAFESADQQALATGNVVHSGPLPSIAGAQLTTYSGTITQAGTGQAITMRSGMYVATLSFFTVTAETSVPPISTALATQVADSQFSLINNAPGGGVSVAATVRRDRAIGGAAIGVAVVMLLLFAWRLRRGHARTVAGRVVRTSGSD